MTFLQRVALTILVVAELGVCAHSRVNESKLQRVIVEEVERNSSAEKAGLQKGDILIAWSSRDGSGEISSPFDVEPVEMDQSPRGTVTLKGLRLTAECDWAIGPDRWGLRVRPDLPEPLVSIYRRAELLVQARKITQAVERWRAAVNEGRKFYSPWLGAWLALREATLFSYARQWKEADNAYREAIQQAEEAAPNVRAQLFRSWAFSYQQRGDSTHAEKYYQLSIAERKKLGAESPSIAEDLDDLGTIFLQRRDLIKAETYYRQALELRAKLAPGSLVMARSLSNLATVIRYPRGDALETAEQYYEQALSIQSELAPKGLDVASSLNNLGTIAWQRGDLVKAEKYLLEALEIRKKLAPGSLDFAASLNELGNVTDLQGDPVRAEQFLWRGLRIRQKLAPDSRDTAQSLTDLASLAEERGNLSKAEQYQREGLDIDRKLAPQGLDVAGDFNNLGYVARDRGYPAQAEKFQLQAWAIEQKFDPDSLYLAETVNSLGDSAGARGDLDQAEKYYRQALAIREKVAAGSADHAATLAALAAINWKKGQPGAAESWYEQTLNALESQTARLGGTQEMRSDFRAAHAGYYKDYVDLLLAEKRPDAALEILERSRARMLLEMMNAAHIDIRQGVDAQLLEREQHLRSDLTAASARRIRLLSSQHSQEQADAIQEEMDKLLAAVKDTEEQIRAASPHYAELAEPKPLSIRMIQEQLQDADTLLLEYSLGRERSHVWAVGTSLLVSYELPKRAEVESAARFVYNLLTEPNRMVRGEKEPERRLRLARAESRYADAASTLSKMLLGPVAEHLGRKRLVIVCDGALQYIPFSVLPVPHSTREDRAGGKLDLTPLVVEHEIVHLPSISVLQALRREELGRQKAPRAVAVLADPVFEKDDNRVNNARQERNQPERNAITNQSAFWSSMPASRLLRSVTDIGVGQTGRSRAIQELRLNRLWFTRFEADTIIANTPAGHGMKAVDFNATRATAISADLSQYRIVHFATHGLLDSRNPEFSGLVFSMVDEKGRPQNGFLDLQDIYNLNLPAEMVVLSSCETGLGKEIDGEGLVGLTRGFMYAGASRVVASLWRVSDVATAQLMGRFYRAMEHDGMRPAAALRMAQVQMWRQKRWQSPYYWAGFQIHGEWQ